MSRDKRYLVSSIHSVKVLIEDLGFDPEIFLSFNHTISHLIILQTMKNKNNQINNLSESIYFWCGTSVGYPKQLLRNCDEVIYFVGNFRKSISYPLSIWKGVMYISKKRS